MKMQRAYSVFEVRSFDDDKRIITGIATTPTPDRYGDVVEPKGAQFKLPIPFLWQHDSGQPIGQVTKAKVTAAGIEVSVQLAKTDTPGTLKDRLDEAWEAIKIGLVRGMSIGFAPIESSRIEGTYSSRFLIWEWLELSAVTIPANAEASIQTVKSIDTALRATLGPSERKARGVVRLDSTPPGDTGAPRKKHPVRIRPKEGNEMNIQEQLKQFRDARAKKAARMAELMEGAGEKGETLDAEQEQEYDDLQNEIDTIDKHIVRLEKLAKVVVEKATPAPASGTGVVVASGAEQQRQAAVARSGVISVPLKAGPGVAFARFVGALAFAKGNFRDALAFAEHRFPNETPLHGVLKMHAAMGGGDAVLKAAVAAGTTSGSGWADDLVNYRIMSDEFIEFLRPQTIVGKFGTNGIPALRRVPFNIKVPKQTGGGSASWVGEGKPKPLTALAFDNVTLKWTKLATIAALTEELVRFSEPAADLIVRDQLAKAIIQQMDADFVDPNNSGTTDVKPASIFNGVSAVASSGDTEERIVEDIRAVFAPFIAANISPESAVWLMSATTALSLSLMLNPLGQPAFPAITMNGGTFKGLPVIVSEAMGTNVGLVNASDILLADDGQVAIDVSREASLQMDSAPDDPATASTVLVSLWQHNMIGIKAERYVNWVKARTAAAQYISGVEWGLEST